MPRLARSVRPALIALMVMATASACGDDAGADPDEITIVTSTSVYGDIASVVAGDLAAVRSIVTSGTQDPHEYEATAQDRLALDGADLIVANGGGYDGFIDTLLEGSDTEAVVLDAVEISGLAPEEDHDESGEEAEEDAEEDGHVHLEGFNEHVWYDAHAVEQVADSIRAELSAIDPDNEVAYQANYDAFAADLETLEAGIEQVHGTIDGQRVLSSEPVPAYLLAEAGLEDVTPAEFTEAVEEGADVPPRALADTLDLIEGGDIAVLAYNPQTETSTTEQVRAAAQAAGIPVVEFVETLPEGASYLTWMQANLDALAEALGAS
jgi:zinc/manganese transport system substrate-binding protein